MVPYNFAWNNRNETRADKETLKYKDRFVSGFIEWTVYVYCRNQQFITYFYTKSSFPLMILYISVFPT